MISLAQIAKLIGVHRNTAIKYMRKGAFPGYSAYEEGGRGYLFTETYQLYEALMGIAVHVVHKGTLTSYPELCPSIRIGWKGFGLPTLIVNDRVVCEYILNESGNRELLMLDSAYTPIEEVIENVLCRVELEALKRSRAQDA